MSILIRGMKMPKNCNECKFGTWSNLHQTAACKRHDFEPCFKDHSREYMDKRADFCPLVEVPAPHGRLIDADKIIKAMDEMKVEGEVFVTAVEYVKLIVGDAPTVIEAERGDKE